MRIAVAGGTGLVGSLTTAEAGIRGHEVVILARARGIDLATGAGVEAALRGADAVIDVSNVNTMKPADSIAFFEAATRSLIMAEQSLGIDRHVALSIVGVDRAPHGYYAGKRAQETQIENSSLRWAILRATQFHEFAEQIYATAAAGLLHLAPKMRTRPIAAREVASRLVDLAESSTDRGYFQLAGPREESLPDMVRRWAAASGRRGWIPAVPLPGPLGKAQRDGTLLPDDSAEIGFETFSEWLRRTTVCAATTS